MNPSLLESLARCHTRDSLRESRDRSLKAQVPRRRVRFLMRRLRAGSVSATLGKLAEASAPPRVESSAVATPDISRMPVAASRYWTVIFEGEELRFSTREAAEQWMENRSTSGANIVRQEPRLAESPAGSDAA